MTEPMLLVRFPGGGHLSIEFIEDAPDDDTPRLGAWLELRAENPEALMQAALDGGLTRVEHPGHPYYFMAPGGQVEDDPSVVGFGWGLVTDHTVRR
jgi:hypothetical protein